MRPLPTCLSNSNILFMRLYYIWLYIIKMKRQSFNFLEAAWKSMLKDTREVTALSLALTLVLDRFQPNVLDCMLKFREELEDGVDQSELDIDNEKLAVHFR